MIYTNIILANLCSATIGMNYLLDYIISLYWIQVIMTIIHGTQETPTYLDTD